MGESMLNRGLGIGALVFALGCNGAPEATPGSTVGSRPTGSGCDEHHDCASAYCDPSAAPAGFEGRCTSATEIVGRADGGLRLDGGGRTDGGRSRDSGSALDAGRPTPRGTGFAAYIGCSQAKLDTRGYQLLGGTRFESYDTGGGVISLWSRDGGGYWQSFDEAVAGKTITVGWVQICVTAGAASNPTAVYDDAVDAIGVFRSKVPSGTSLYVSGLEIFVDPCPIAGNGVPEMTREIADQLAADGVALRGPDLGPIDASQTTDGCHPNAAGMAITGGQLLDFFGP